MNAATQTAQGITKNHAADATVNGPSLVYKLDVAETQALRDAGALDRCGIWTTDAADYMVLLVGKRSMLIVTAK